MSQEALEIKVGADLAAATQAFQQLQKDIEKAMQGGAASFQKFVSSYQTQVPKIQKGTVDATNSLINFNRILQDAPYGLVGVSNNINPMLESFQRLQKETGSAGAALSAMVSGLTGPAGIGIAVAAVTSFLVAFGGKLFEAGEKAEYLGDDLKTMAANAEGAKKAIQDLGNELTFLNSISSIRVQIRGGDSADVMKRQIYSLRYAVQQIEEGMPYLNQQASELVGRVAGAPVGSDEQKQAQEALDKANDAIKEAIKQKADFNKQIVTLDEQATLEQVKAAKERAKKVKEELSKQQFNFFDTFFKANPDSSQVERQVKDMAKVAREFANKNRDVFQGLGGILTAGSDKEIIAAGKPFWEAYQKGIVKFKPPAITLKDLTLIPEVKPDDAKRFVDEYSKAIEGIRDKKNGVIGAGDLAQGEAAFKKFRDLGGRVAAPFDEEKIAQAKAYADTISGVVTPAFQGMFDSLFEGKNVVQGFFQGIANGLKSLLSRMAAAIVEALALKAVFSAFGLTSGIGAGKIGDIFGKLMGFADGGIPPIGRASIVGERGPELFVPSTRGVIVPNDKLQGFGGMQTVRIVGEFRQSGRDLVATIIQENQSQGRRY